MRNQEVKFWKEHCLLATLLALAAVSVALWLAACSDTTAPHEEALLTLTTFSYGASGTLLPDGTVVAADSVTLADTARGAGHAAWRFDLARERIVGDTSKVGFTRWAFELHPEMLARSNTLFREAF